MKENNLKKMKTSFIKKIIGCSLLTLLFAMSIAPNVSATAISNTCDGNGAIDTGELCDNDRLDDGHNDIFFAPDGSGDDDDCDAWGFLDDVGHSVTCDNINCDVDVTACTGKRTTLIQGWGGEIAPDNIPTDIKATTMSTINWILGFIAIITTLVIIYGGVLYLTAAGNEENITAAKKTIVYGILGIMITGLAYAIVIVISTVILTIT